MRRLELVTVERFEELRARLDAARVEYQRVLEAHKEVIQFSGSIPDLDGTRDLYRANRNLKTAFERYTMALENLTDYVLHRTQM